MWRITVFIIIWLLVVVFCPALGAAKTKEEAFVEFNKLQEERIRQGKELLTLLDLINMYSDEDKKKILQETVKNNGIYLEIKERWDLIDDPSTALGWAYHEKEPFNEKILGTLERTFNMSKDKSESLRIAALLYRYNKNMGREYLFNALLEKHDAEAALILTLNQAQEALVGIKEVFESIIPSSELIYALGRWGSEASPLLAEGFLTSRGSPVDYIRALTMAEHQVDRTIIERIKQMYEGGQGITKVEAAAALIRLQPGNREPLEYLSSKLENWQALPESELFSVIKALSRDESVRTKELFTRIVESYASNQESTYVRPTHIEAALALVKMGGEREKLLVVHMLRKMARESISDKRDIYTIAQAIYDSGLPNSADILNGLMGDGFTTRVRRMRELRTLPVRFLPIFSQEFVGKLYWVE